MFYNDYLIFAPGIELLACSSNFIHFVDGVQAKFEHKKCVGKVLLLMLRKIAVQACFLPGNYICAKESKKRKFDQREWSAKKYAAKKCDGE